MKNKLIIKRILFILSDIILAALACFSIVFCMRMVDSMKLNVYFGESHAGKTNISQLFSGSNNDFSENDVKTVVFDDNVLTFDLNGIDFKNNIIRLDPFNKKRNFSILKIEFVIGEKYGFELTGNEIKSYISKTKGVKVSWNDDSVVCKGKNKNPRFIFNKSFSERIYKYIFFFKYGIYYVASIVLAIFGILQIIALRHEENNNRNKKSIVCFSFVDILLLLATAFIYALIFFEKHFGQVPFGQLVYHFHTPLDGTDVSSYRGNIVTGVVITLAVTVISAVIYRLLAKAKAHFGYVAWLFSVVCVMLVCTAYRAVVHFKIDEYYKYTHESTDLYDNYYADGKNVNITFPDKKRNLIYIFLESMEVTFAGTDAGGAMQENIIPGLTDIALNSESFSDGTALNGAHQVSGATFTMGALAAQTCGVSINESIVSNDTLNGNWESENNYFPGVWSLGDVLKQQGYNQEFLIGSDGRFAGRSSYFKGHGDYLIEDYIAAIDEKRIPADYKVWWGYEDEKLFKFAKEDLVKLSKKNEPFNFTMLTVDTHFTDGYKCELCEDKYDSQYSNVIACSDSQTTEFIEWIKKQDFYDNTTIIICGDHLTPDTSYINSQGVSAFDRRTFTAIINPADGKKYNGAVRVYTTLDMYPTTLSALGAQIEGNRLGLGVDLYSDTPTLAEQFGLDYINTELLKNSKFYKEKLLYSK